MAYRVYDKEYQSPEDLVLYMKTKGLTVGDEQSAQKFLENVNYYRFKIYLWPFLDATLSSYVPHSTFEQGVELYRFDEELRNFIFTIICKIEIKLRSKLDQVVASYSNNPFWYLENELFIKNKIYSMDGVRASLASYFQQSQDDFSKHFKDNYYNEVNANFKQLPPFWVLTELATFGQVRTVYSSLEKSIFQGAQNTNELNTLAHDFGAKNYKELNNWITAIRDVRNRCAHHSRVWNANHRQAGGVLNKLDPKYLPTNNNKIYLFCVLLKLIDDRLGMGFDINITLQSLFNKYPAAQLKCHSAGFPHDWHKDDIWAK
ncbi:Abi family protein [Pseudoalteromonas sp. BSi20495]|uniref:Abi family protein n=1 Tax=Pseudoalteromonas sp. BSi20495 TaxID=386429 RepID=UPI00023160DB|nr:Abi family protein [Pseudoalteromonas sp. BSi20495]GAA78396.1 hypothetical protein P20495_0887 [Pseudoalteromonas sp. BSi20495]